MIINDNGIPSIEGMALFSKHKFTGEILKKQEAILASIMQNKRGKYTRLSYDWKEKESPITIQIINVKRKIKISSEKINVKYDINFSVEEFHVNNLNRPEVRREAEKFLSAVLKKDFEKIIEKTKEAKSDIVGFGRSVHAFHPELWKRGDWQETYATLPIEVDVKAEMKRTNILD